MATRPPTVRLLRRETRRAGKSSGRTHAARVRSGVAAVALLAGAGVLPAGCGPRAVTPCAGRGYTLRGQVVAMMPRGGGPRLITLRHEPVDDFADRQGKVVGMDSMTMPFPVARGVPLTAVAPGDTVAVTLCVDWQADPELAVTALRKLPAGTRLGFRPARPAARPGPGQSGPLDPSGHSEGSGH
jgi:hypothetical protein